LKTWMNSKHWLKNSGVNTSQFEGSQRTFFCAVLNQHSGHVSAPFF